MSSFKLTKAGFLRWLDAQPDNKRATCGDVHKCILADYAAEQTGRLVQVDGDGITVFLPGVTLKQLNSTLDTGLSQFDGLVDYTIEHPEWSQNVMTMFDHFDTWTTPDGGKKTHQPTMGRVREYIKRAANKKGLIW